MSNFRIKDTENAAWYALCESVKDYRVGDPLPINKLDFINKFREYLGLPEKQALDQGKDPLDWLEEQVQEKKGTDPGLTI